VDRIRGPARGAASEVAESEAERSRNPWGRPIAKADSGSFAGWEAPPQVDPWGPSSSAYVERERDAVRESWRADNEREEVLKAKVAEQYQRRYGATAEGGRQFADLMAALGRPR
jgi:hypothetical protein